VKLSGILDCSRNFFKYYKKSDTPTITGGGENFPIIFIKDKNDKTSVFQIVFAFSPVKTNEFVFAEEKTKTI
jgi:restriction endonuclease S subunit